MCFKKLGLAAADEIWLIEKALYGLVASPRDWGLYRDEMTPIRYGGTEKLMVTCW